MRMKYENPKLKQCQIANQISVLTSSLQTYRNDINMFSPYRNNPKNTNKRIKNASNTNFHLVNMTPKNLKRPQVTSFNLIQIQNQIRKTNMFQKFDPYTRILKLTINI